MSDTTLNPALMRESAAVAGITSQLTNTVGQVSKSFLSFLVDKKVLTIGIGLMIASQLSVLTNTFTKSIINPIINKLIKDKTQTLDELEVEIVGVKFEVGKLISSIINFLIVLIILYYLYKLEIKLNNIANGK
jgi:large conductance mechanosensitive channel